jgi:hypothetical protein
MALSVLWRRLDTPGHDACRLVERPGGYKLRGAAVFLRGQGPALVNYSLVCDAGFRTQHGRVRGWLGDKRFRFHIERDAAGRWTCNGAIVEGLDDCIDLDYGFTPATNLAPIKRLGLRIGESAEAPAAWLNIPEGTLERLPQRYERRGPDCYWYEAPAVGYAALLEMTPAGFTRLYPGLWPLEP